jgi:hypothetical protein
MLTTKDPADFMELGVSTLPDDNAVVVVLELRADGETVYSTGSAKRHPGDQRNLNAGKQLALGRALLELGSALVNAGNTSTTL